MDAATQETSTSFYRVVVADNNEGCDKCGHGKFWDIVYVDAFGEEISCGTSYGDEALTIDICDLMNMAYDAGVESHPQMPRIPKAQLSFDRPLPGDIDAAHWIALDVGDHGMCVVICASMEGGSKAPHAEKIISLLLSASE